MGVAAALRERVAADLGEKLAAQYEEGVSLTEAGSQEGAGEKGVAAADALSGATEVFVQALSSVPEEKTRSAGFAELLLAYGKSLLVYVRRQALEESVLAGDVEAEIKAMAEKARDKVLDVEENVDEDVHVEVISRPEEGRSQQSCEKKADGFHQDGVENGDARKLSESGIDPTPSTISASEQVPNVGVSKLIDGPTNLADSTSADVKVCCSVNVDNNDNNDNSVDMDAKKKTEADESDPADADGDENEEDISTAELAWEQLETARVIYEDLGAGHDDRLAAVHEAIGDFIIETDGYEARAAEEYGKAVDAEIRAHGSASRLVADLQHRRYLSLRRDAPAEAVAAMEAAVGSFRKFIASGEGDEQDNETLEMLQQDLSAYKDSLGSTLTTVIGFKKDAPPPQSSFKSEGVAENDQVVAVSREAVPVTVQPKRRAKAGHADSALRTDPDGREGFEPSAKKQKVDSIMSSSK